MTTKSRPLPTEPTSGPGAPTSKADHAYQTILQAIRDGVYGPGERLVFERLARAMDISVVPVREAIRRLEADGFVTFTRNVGATVTSVDVDRYAETIQTVASLEGIAIGLAYPHLTADVIRRARHANDRLRAQLDPFDAASFSSLNLRFQEILFDACPNRHLVCMLEREWALLATTRSSAFIAAPEHASESVVEHDELLDMIERDAGAEAVERYTREHRMLTAQLVLEQLARTAPATS